MIQWKANYESSSIMIIDDTVENLSVLSAVLREKGHEVRPVPSGKLALKAAANKPPDLILLDISMPDMDGYEVCRRLKQNPELKDIPVIFISALSETLDKVRAFNLGGVDYITKPFHYEEVNSRIETHLELRRLTVNLEHIVERQVEEITEAQMSTIFAMAKLTESRDDATGKHLDRVRTYCYLMANELGEMSEYALFINKRWSQIISQASVLHDIGKVGIPDRILLKKGKLTDEEMTLMKQHTIIGAKTLRDVQQIYPENIFISTGLEIAKWHHERWDGKGYPNGLKGEEIPLPARIMSIADVYDALKSERCYKEAFPHEKCCDLIIEGEGTQFDPVLIKVFKKVNEKMLDAWIRMQ